MNTTRASHYGADVIFTMVISLYAFDMIYNDMQRTFFVNKETSFVLCARFSISFLSLA